MSSGKLNINVDGILERIGMVIKNHRNEAIAEALGQSSSTVSNWKIRGTIPWVPVWEFAEKHDVNFLWIFTGKGDEKDQKEAADLTAKLREEVAVLQAELKEAQELMQKYESIIKHYERIIETQSKQIEHFQSLLKSANHSPETDFARKTAPF